MAIPTDPQITPCEHVFCRQCIRQALNVTNLCPIDREPCSIRQLQPLQGCLFRIWSSIQVKCGIHDAGCAWTGSVGDYTNHITQCSISNSRESALRQELELLKQENALLRKELEDRPNLPILFEGEYYFRRENVVQLSQLISRYLEEKPADIDANRIYNCVRSCYMDMDKQYSDNPEFYRIDMKMLLATCQASTWFSDKQNNNIRDWYNSHF